MAEKIDKKTGEIIDSGYVKPLVFDSVESSSTKFDKYGREIPDRRPLELLLSLQTAVKTNEQKMKEVIARELNKLARARGFETIEESNDFSMDSEDYVALSGYEFSEEVSYMDKGPDAAASPAAAPAEAPAPTPAPDGAK